MAALTANDPVFQPGFEDADTSVSAAVCLYGFYGNRDLGGLLPSSPHAYVRRDAPPFFIAHGDNDTFIPATSAESFVDALRGVSMNPVVYARLPGAQHSFDLLDSVRFQYVIDGVEAFTARVRARGDPPSAQLTTAWPPSRAIPTEAPRTRGLRTELAS